MPWIVSRLMITELLTNPRHSFHGVVINNEAHESNDFCKEHVDSFRKAIILAKDNLSKQSKKD